jgi:thymidylate kinase
MIIMIGGIPCSGKSTLMREIISGLGSAENVEPMKLFSCQKHNDILVLGRYAEGEPFGGTDRLSYGTIKKFREFIDQEHQNYKHIIFEGDRFFRVVDIKWLIEKHDSKVLVLKVDAEEEVRRHKERNDTQTEKWLRGRRKQIHNISEEVGFTHPSKYKNHIRQVNNKEDMLVVRDEIIKYLGL